MSNTRKHKVTENIQSEMSHLEWNRIKSIQNNTLQCCMSRADLLSYFSLGLLNKSASEIITTASFNMFLRTVRLITHSVFPQY